MTTFDKREAAEENKYAHDEQMKFKVTARRNKLLGLWLAGQFGLSGADADAYAKEVVMADLEEVGDDDVVKKCLADIAARKLDISEHRLRGRMAEMAQEAAKQLMAE